VAAVAALLCFVQGRCSTASAVDTGPPCNCNGGSTVSGGPPVYLSASAQMGSHYSNSSPTTHSVRHSCSAVWPNTPAAYKAA